MRWVTYRAVGLVDAGHVYARHEFHKRGPLGILAAAVDVHGVDAALVHRLQRPKRLRGLRGEKNATATQYKEEGTYVRRADDGASPAGEHAVVGISETIAHSTITDALFALLQLLKKLEVARDYAVARKSIDQLLQPRLIFPAFLG